MIKGIAYDLAALAALTIFAPAAAQTVQAPSPAQDIVVEGSKPESSDLRSVARAITPPGDLYHEPLAQFQQPVCPGVVGVPIDVAKVMVTRIREVAGRVGTRLARDERCQVNLLVAFLKDGQAALRNLRYGGPWLFGTTTPADLQDLSADPGLGDLAAQPGPVHVWTNTEMRSRDGELLSGGTSPADPAVLRGIGSASRMELAARQDVVASLVIIDVGAIRDVSPTQLADYAAMRGLVQTRPPGMPGKVGTILSLFDKDAIVPLEITRFDIAYLRAVYGSPANMPGISKVARVAYEAGNGTRKD